MICSTAAPNYVVTKAMMAQVVPERRYRPILFVDIAVPRDVDPKVAQLDNCFVYDVDDLQAVLEANREQRRKAAEAADRLLEEELEEHLKWSRSQAVVPVIKALRGQAMDIVKAELQRTLPALHGASEKKIDQSVRAMGNAIMNKLLHPVLTELREASAQGDPEELAAVIERLFALEVAQAAKPKASPLANDLDKADAPPAATVSAEEGEQPGAKVLSIQRRLKNG